LPNLVKRVLAINGGTKIFEQIDVFILGIGQISFINHLRIPPLHING